MGEVAAVPPPDPQDQMADALRRAVAAVEAGTAVAGLAIAGRGDLIELLAWERRLAEALGDVRAASLMLVAAAQPAVPEAEVPGRHRHRAPSRRPRGLLWSVPGASAILGVLRAHGWAAHAAQVAASAPAAAAVAVLTAATVAAPPGHAVPPVSHHAHHARHALAPSVVVRRPAPGRSSPSAPPRPDAVAADRPGPRAPRPADVPVPLPAVVPSPGVLAVDDPVVQLRGESSETVTLTAEGGPVTWSAGQQPGVVVVPGSGTLQAGDSVTVTVIVTDLTHSGFAIVDLGGVSLSVSWLAADGGLPDMALPAGI